MVKRKTWLDTTVPTVVLESPDARFHIALQRGPLVLARDAKLGEDVDKAVDILYDADEYVAAVASRKAGFDTQIELSIPQVHGGSFTAIDYASAGKTWRAEARFGRWMKTRTE